MYCPRCATQAVPGQRFCRNCGANLGSILDAMDNRRGPIDFETLKRDLGDLGAALRKGYEGAQDAIKNTSRLKNPVGVPAPPVPAPPTAVVLPELQRELKRAVKKINAADSRKLSLQKAMFSVFGGGAYMFVWSKVLEAVTRPEVIANIEEVIRQANPQITNLDLDPFAPILRLFWLFGLIPVAKGIAYLINGIFLAPQPEPEPAPQPLFMQSPPPVQNTPPPYASAIPPTNEFDRQTPESITEDATLRFEAKETT